MEPDFSFPIYLPFGFPSEQKGFLMRRALATYLFMPHRYVASARLAEAEQIG